ncbi:sulfur oxidation c-type cytochrome SoxA [Aquabacter sp. CN5-332]|uniref:sulfur oxidation c-type cytochrome SoxA n=1 Tax=Aquabacter sp. CN5-332 TaxID=3156608 RepID=UPI0032B54599
MRAASLAALLLSASGAAGIEQAERRSGIEFASPETQAMQADDTANPGMFWVLDGAELWRKREGAAGKSCADCHQDAAKSMRGVAARYPDFDAQSGRPVDLSGRINLCRANHQQAAPLGHESPQMLALTAFVANQSRGMPVTPAADPRLANNLAEGRRLFEQRMGQLDLSCANCHDDHWNARLGGSAVTQAQPNAYPLYRLEWQSLGSLQRRMRACMVGVRAEPFDYGAPEFVDLELYLMSRATGLKMETPGVRP